VIRLLQGLCSSQMTGGGPQARAILSECTRSLQDEDAVLSARLAALPSLIDGARQRYEKALFDPPLGLERQQYFGIPAEHKNEMRSLERERELLVVRHGKLMPIIQVLAVIAAAA
jgi:hypothetical protein